jgi:hypothetical protein
MSLTRLVQGINDSLICNWDLSLRIDLTQFFLFKDTHIFTVQASDTVVRYKCSYMELLRDKVIRHRLFPSFTSLEK